MMMEHSQSGGLIQFSNDEKQVVRLEDVLKRRPKEVVLAEFAAKMKHLHPEMFQQD